MPEPRAYTADEIRDMVLQHVWDLVRYWGADTRAPTFPIDRPKDECLEGLAFSILAMLDGASPEVPGFKLVPTPHPDDEDYHRREGTNWFSSDVHVHTALHEYFHSSDPRRQHGRPSS